MADIIKSAEVTTNCTESFDKGFNLEAVNLVVKQKRPVSAVAKELGIHENTLYKWIRQASDNLSSKAEVMRKLKRKIADLEEENEILKKATVYFAKHQK